MLRLIDAKGAALLEFTEVESGLFESERGADGLLFLQTQASLKIEIRTDRSDGWRLEPAARGRQAAVPDHAGGRRQVGRTIIAWSSSPAATRRSRAFGLSTWRLDGDHLLLAGRSGTWRFSESDATVWERVPLSIDPLLLVRQ